MRFDADAAGLVTLQARWQAFSESGRTLLAAEETLVSEPAAEAGKAAVVAAMSRALSRLAADVAKAMAGNPGRGSRAAQNSMPTVNETLALHWLLPHSLAR